MNKILIAFVMVLITLSAYGADRIETDRIIYEIPPCITNAGGGGLNIIGASSNTIYTNSINISLNNISYVNFTNISGRVDYYIYGKIYIANMNDGQLDQTCNFSIYNRTNMLGEDCIFRTTNGQVRLFARNAVASVATGDTTITVDDASGFAKNCLVFLDGSNEYCRVNDITGAILTFETPILNGHAINSAVSRVNEYALRVNNKDSSSNFYGRITFAGNITLTSVTNVVEISP